MMWRVIICWGGGLEVGLYAQPIKLTAASRGASMIVLSVDY